MTKQIKNTKENISEIKENVLRGFIEMLKKEWVGKIKGTYSVDVGNEIVMKIKAPTEGHGVVFENRLYEAMFKYMEETK